MIKTLATCSSCGKEYGRYQAKEGKCFFCQVSERKGFDEVTRGIMEKNPVPNCFFMFKK